jgi:hypothetical protein
MDALLTQETLELLKASPLAKDTTTTGISTGTGLLFYNLEPLARRIYPVHYPLLASIPRVVSPNAGSGTSVNWKAIVGADSTNGGYPGISEGHRNAFMPVTERNYQAAFKYLGKDIFTTFQAQYGGEGFDDARGQAQVNLLNSLLNSEERMILFGNSGTSGLGNGFQLGTCGAPTVALKATAAIVASQAVGSGFANSTNVSVACVALTGWGLQMGSVSSGIVTSFTRTNADSTPDVIYGGSSAISAISAVVTALTATPYVQATVTPIAGAMGYAWYVDSTDAGTGSLANAKLVAITPTPTVYLGSVAAGGAQTGTATGLNADNSANPLDFDGITTWTLGVGQAQGSYWKDLRGAGLTANGDGTIQEFEDVLNYLWNAFKLAPSKIYVGGSLISTITKAILTGPASGSTTGVSVQRLNFTTDQAGALTGGTLAASYRKKYIVSAQAGTADIPMQTHPWLPDGVILFDLEENPYPGSNIPAVRRIMTMADHFSIAWPLKSLQWEIGAYCFETMQHYIPFGSAMLTGVGHLVNGQPA